MNPLLHIQNLSVSYPGQGSRKMVLDQVELLIPQKSIVALLGETGSGKSTLGKCIIRLLSPQAQIAEGGSIEFKGRTLLQSSESQMVDIRRSEIATIPQNPLLASNPLMRCGKQIIEILSTRHRESKHDLKQRAIDWFKKMELEDPHRVFRSFPHQLSLGQLQRVCIAIALASQPSLIIADEPFASLDQETSRELMQLILRLKESEHLSILLITHEIESVSTMADLWYVLYQGKIVGHGTESFLETKATHPHIQTLLKRYWDLTPAPLTGRKLNEIISIQHVYHRYDSTKMGIQRQQIPSALTDVSLSIYKGEILGLIGRSGSGKSTLAKLLGGLLTLQEGTISFEQQSIQQLLLHDEKSYYQKVQYIMQDAASALPPRRSVAKILAETIGAFHPNRSANVDSDIDKLLRDIRLDATFRDRQRSQLSGGEKQRVCLARALAAQPKLLIMDESLASLDLGVQYEMLHILKELRSKKQLTILIVSHDLRLIAHVCDRIVRMQDGRLSPHT